MIQNPELAARIEKLKAQQANREYAAMTRNVDVKVNFCAYLGLLLMLTVLLT